MFVRPLNPDEVLSALHLIWEVYASDVAPLQNPEAVAGFRELIRYEHIMPRIQNKEVILFGAWEGTELAESAASIIAAMCCFCMCEKNG